MKQGRLLKYCRSRFEAINNAISLKPLSQSYTTISDVVDKIAH